MNETVVEGAQRWPVFFLASVLTAYPDAEFIGDVASFINDTEVEKFGAAAAPAAWGKVKQRVLGLLAGDAGMADDLRSEYIDVFDRGASASPLYETEYGRDRSLRKANELADLAGFYAAFGMSVGGEGSVHEMLDHVSVELEFYALLLLKQQKLGVMQDAAGGQIVCEARRKFLADHLGRFIGAIAARPGVQASETFAPIFTWCHELVRAECAQLGVDTESLAWISTEAEPAGIECGAACATGRG